MRKLLRTLFLLFILNAPFIISGGGEAKVDVSRINNFVEYNTELTNIKTRLEVKDSIAYHTLDSIPIYCPIKVNTLKSISSDYGWRVHPIFGHWHKHTGIDITAKSGTNVFSAGPGTVELVKTSKYGYGNQIVISHAAGYKTRYAHLKDIYVKEGDIVTPKQLIGTVGNSGLTTGYHLHYELLKNNWPIDPLFFTYSDREQRTQGNYFTAMIALEKY